MKIRKILFIVLSLLFCIVLVSADDLYATTASLEMFVDELPDMPKLKGFVISTNGSLSSGYLRIGMFQTQWVCIVAFSFSMKRISFDNRSSYGLWYQKFWIWLCNFFFKVNILDEFGIEKIMLNYRVWIRNVDVKKCYKSNSNKTTHSKS